MTRQMTGAAVGRWIERLRLLGVVVVMVVVLGLTACAGGSEPPTSSPADTSPELQVAGCVPLCGAGGRLAPLDLSVGTYRTDGFFGGAMEVTVGEGWTSPEDSSGEFAVVPDDDAGGVAFWLDVYPVERFARVDDVPLTADAVSDWLRSNPDLDVSAATPGSIGDLPATVVDVRLADDARNDSVADSRAAGMTPEDIRYCHHGHQVCSFFLGFQQWEFVWGIGVWDEVQRFYLSDVTYDGTDHLFVAVVWANPAKDQDVMLEAGQDIIDTVQVPATSR